MGATRVVLLTGDARRHRYAASRVAEDLALVGVVTEEKRPVITAAELLPSDDRVVIDKHLEDRAQAEARLLGSPGAPRCDTLSVASGAVNSVDVYEWVAQRGPDVVVLYGTSIIEGPLLQHYSHRLVNVHLGLSPYYRGAGTNFWPLVDRVPECVGATVHLAILEVDAGPILGQIRPEPFATDTAHDLGTKTIIAAFGVLAALLQRYLKGVVKPHAQDLSVGKVFRRKDFSADAVRRMWNNFETGMMDEYCAAKEERWIKFPIVDPLSGDPAEP